MVYEVEMFVYCMSKCFDMKNKSVGGLSQAVKLIYSGSEEWAEMASHGWINSS